MIPNHVTIIGQKGFTLIFMHINMSSRSQINKFSDCLNVSGWVCYYFELITIIKV